MLVGVFAQRGFATGAADEDSATGDVNWYGSAHRIQIGSRDRADLLNGDKILIFGREFAFLRATSNG